MFSFTIFIYHLSGENRKCDHLGYLQILTMEYYFLRLNVNKSTYFPTSPKKSLLNRIYNSRMSRCHFL